MLKEKIILACIITSLTIQFLPSRTYDNMGCDKTSESNSVIVSNNADDLDEDDAATFFFTADQASAMSRNVYGESENLSNHSVPIYCNYLTDIITPPPEKTAC
jgi:hypothetical protein